jgi:putative sporulation protein YtxC
VKAVKLLTIGFKDCDEENDKIKKKMEDLCESLGYGGYVVVIEDVVKGSYRFIGYYVNEGELSFRNYEQVKGQIKKMAVRFLADHVVRVEEKRLIKRMIEREYVYFSDKERQQVFESVVSRYDHDVANCTEFNLPTRRQYIAEKMLDYLENSHDIVLEGFINFRLKEYRKHMMEAVDKAVDDFMMELEYQEFIRVLRYFVDVQQPKMEEVHVVMMASGNFKILDSKGKVIRSRYIENADREGMSYQDLLISSLITLAPYTVMLHLIHPSMSEELIMTIKSVFDGRVIVCDGCDLCRNVYANQLQPKS